MEINLRHGTGYIDDEDAWVLDGWWWMSQVSSRPKWMGGEPRIYIMGRPTTIAAALKSSLTEIASIFPMHRLILGMPRYAEDRRDVDHINGNGLDNRRANLRIPEKTKTTPTTSRSQNLANSGSRPGTSDFKGVSLCRQTQRWKAQIMVDGVNQNLGRFDTPEEAAVVYNEAAVKAWGEYAQLNTVGANVTPVRKPRATSQYRGVSFDRTRQKWIAQISVGGKHRVLGRYGTEFEAALAYNEAAKTALGDKARLNDIVAAQDSEDGQWIDV